VFVAPILFLPGTTLELREAMSCGTPPVASSIAASGLTLRDGAETLIGKDDDDFTDKVLELDVNETLGHKIQHPAQDHLRDRCSPETMKRQLAAILDLDTNTFEAR
jgi:glycosyltransferase involved in cell wall biosynthesis